MLGDAATSSAQHAERPCFVEDEAEFVAELEFDLYIITISAGTFSIIRMG